ncbi:helix-turn-helix domain-containing protein, partial [Bacillus sp. GMs2/2]|uniref:helix-turn-helix domain-containing protein n=1 Tax=Bacillus sp. GMs2/2 TaxID=3418494 RepID=UPI003CEB58BA
KLYKKRPLLRVAPKRRNGCRTPNKREDKVAIAIKMYKSKDYTIKEITDATGISKTTLYRYLDKAH